MTEPHPQPKHPLEVAVENIGKNPKTMHHQHCDHECVCMTYEIAFEKGWRKQGAICTNGGCEYDTRPHTPAAPAMDTLADLKITASMLYEFCEWFCDYDCEEKPCNVTVSLLHERLEGIKKQMEEHPEYLEKWNAKRIEQKTLLRGGAP